MKADEAIQQAINYEEKIRDVYMEAAESIDNPAIKNILQALGKEEQHHVEYLEHKLKQWLENGEITLDQLETTVPSPQKIEAGLQKVKFKILVDNKEDELKILEKAREVEIATKNFYHDMTRKMTDRMQEMFAHFLEIEEGHLAIVEAEIDAVMGMGFWFDFGEFNLEKE